MPVIKMGKKSMEIFLYSLVVECLMHARVCIIIMGKNNYLTLIFEFCSQIAPFSNYVVKDLVYFSQ